MDAKQLQTFQNSILAGALGDALGYLVEFDSSYEIKKQYGDEGPETPVVKGRSIVSDDTQMTLFSLEAILDSKSGDEIFYQAREAYLRWFETQRSNSPKPGTKGISSVSEMWFPRAPGMTCMNALSAGAVGSIHMRANDSKGCGTVMRAAPFALVPLLFPGLSAGEEAEKASYITHGHSEAGYSSFILAEIVSGALSGEDFKTSVNQALQALSVKAPGCRTLELCHRAMVLSETSDVLSPPEGLGAGWVAEEAMAVGLWAAAIVDQGRSKVWHAMMASANHGGDSDSTASVAGNMIGAFWGLDEDMKLDCSTLDVLPAVTMLFDRLAPLCSADSKPRI